MHTHIHTTTTANHPVIIAGNVSAIDTVEQDPVASTTQTKTIQLSVAAANCYRMSSVHSWAETKQQSSLSCSMATQHNIVLQESCVLN